MRRDRRVRPFGSAVPATRLVSLAFAVAVLWVIYDRARDPGTWRWLAPGEVAEEPADDVPPTAAPAVPVPETIVPGPNDLDEHSAGTLGPLLELVRDRAPLRPEEMGAYWRFMAWSRSQPLADLEPRATAGVPFVQIWEQPDRYRGKLLRLRLHVKRVLHFEAPPNPAGVKEVYEVWGWTDDSLSLPYVVVMPELPPGLKVGAETRGEIVFTGYFLKVTAYKAVEATRGAPLLVGRAGPAQGASAAPPRRRTNDGDFDGLTVAALALVGGFGVWAAVRHLRGRAKSPRSRSPAAAVDLSALSAAGPQVDAAPPEAAADDGATRTKQGADSWL